MSLTTILLALFLGVLFGFALNKAGLTRYTKLVNQFRLTDFSVLKFMMTALVVTMLGVYPLRELGIITFPTGLRGGYGPGGLLPRYCRGGCR
jgi:Na+/H+-dicarboxylate symporter